MVHGLWETLVSTKWRLNFWAELFKAGLRQPRVSARFELRFESLKSISVLILFVYKLMIGSSKNNRENYLRKCFWTQEKETWVKFNPGLSANRPSNNWALDSAIHQAPVVQTSDSTIHRINHYPADKYYGNQLRYPLDSDLSGGQRYPTFEQPGPESNWVGNTLMVAKRFEVLANHRAE